MSRYTSTSQAAPNANEDDGDYREYFSQIVIFSL